MRPVQTAVGAFAAVAIGIAALSSGMMMAVAAATLTFYGVVWTWATVGRVRYWRPRGGRQSEQCPNCHANRKRLGGDWILECKKCGWRPSWPFLRHISHGVIGVQAQRTVSAGGAFLVGAAAALILTGDATMSGGTPVPEALLLPEVSLGEANLRSILEQVALAVSALLLAVLGFTW